MAWHILFWLKIKLIKWLFFCFQAMGCCGQAEEGDEDKKARKQNKEIEKQIQKDKQVSLQ